MKRIVLSILAFFLILINIATQAATSFVEKEITSVSKDGFTIKANFSYPKNKNQKDFPTVVLLHSLGYNSAWWGGLERDLQNRGFAVLKIDLRGHGKSIYNAKMTKISWKSLKNSAYSKYSDDIIGVINVIKEENTKKTFFNNWAIIGADIGASAGVIASDKLPVKPKTIVMLSPVVRSKGLFIPVSVAHLDDVDFLAVYGTDDTDSMEAGKYLNKFAQAQFLEYTSEAKTTGMLMIKNDPSLSKILTEWVANYFK